MKILFLAGLLGVIAAAVLAFMTRSSLLESRREKDRINREIVKTHDATEKVNEETRKTHGAWLENMTLAKDEATAAKKLKLEMDEKEEQLKAVNKTIEDILAKRTQMNEEINRIIGRDGTPEEVLAKVESLKGETDALSKDLDTLTKELDLNKKVAGESDALAARLKAQQTGREKAIKLAGRSARIAYVNQEYSFVIINMGKNDGVTMDARLLVKRGGQYLGKLNITNIEPGQTVAEINLKSLAPGVQILPGDEVVFENSTT